MQEPSQSVSRWKSPFWTQVRAGVLAGVILIAITAVGGLVIAKASKLS